MTSGILLWKELSDHFTSLENDLLNKSEALKRKIHNLNHQTNESLHLLRSRKTSIDGTLQIAVRNLDSHIEAALSAISHPHTDADGEVDNGEGLMLKLKLFCLKMDTLGFWGFVIGKKKELEGLKAEMPVALGECMDPANFVLDLGRRDPATVNQSTLQNSESMQLSFDARGNSVPTILLLMQRHLYAHGGLQAEGIFIINAGNSQEEFVREQLNREVVPDGIDMHCLAGLIKILAQHIKAVLPT